MRARRVFVVALLIVLFPTVGNARQEQSTAHQKIDRFQLTQRGGGLGYYLDETVTFSSNQSHPNDWFLERHRTEKKCGLGRPETCHPISVHDWATSKSCPALAGLMRELPEARKASLAIMRERARRNVYVTVSDTPLLSLEALPHGAFQPQSEWEGPLVDWWRSSEERLKQCWTDYPP